MLRQARLDAPGTLHHVMVRGIAGNQIFKGDQDRQDFITWEVRAERFLGFEQRSLFN